MDKKFNWISGALLYSFLVALIPGIIGLLSEIFEKLNNIVGGWFWGTPWVIKIPIYILIGLLINFFRPFYKTKD